MARIEGVDLPKDKKIVIALQSIYGIGLSSAQDILEATNVSEDKRVYELDDDEIARLREEIDKNYTVEGALRVSRNNDIKRLMEIDCYRGIRHKKGLPVRGQRTRSNARTRKGNK